MEKLSHLSSSHVSFLSYDFLKRCIFCNFVLTLARNLRLLGKFRYSHPKDLVRNVQKMVIFFMLLLTVLDILGSQVE